MGDQGTDWHQWQRFFAGRSERPLPRLDAKADYAHLPPSLARSLAIFQLGESGGGTVVDQARSSALREIDERYADAMALFVAEEHRHANILAICVRMLGGSLIRKNWTAWLFIAGRRLIGLRLKVLVLLAAEVVGICYYHLLASRLPEGQIRDMLTELVDDERAHLYFHCAFLRSQADGAGRRLLFRTTWRLTMWAAAAVVMVDHRAAIRDLGLERRAIWARWMSYSRLAEHLVTGEGASGRLIGRYVPEFGR